MIDICDLTARRDGVTVLSEVSTTVGDGEFVLVVGPNGAGKTTLLRHLNGLADPDAGDVRVNGTPVAEDLVAARTAVGMVFQNPRDGFVAATVGADVAFGPENLGLSREEIDRRVDESLDVVGMRERAEARIADLSGGEQARVAIAGALAMEPDHLVLDEPLSGLDERARQSVVDRLGDLHATGTGVVLATHDLRDVLGLADRIVALEGGAVVLDGAPDEVVDRLPSVGVRPPC